MKKLQRLITATVMALTVLGAAPALAKTSCNIKMKQINQLHTGMSYAEVLTLVGCEGDHTLHMSALGFDDYKWHNSSLSFKDGGLSSWYTNGNED